jgi:hypothetical protein
MDESFQGSIDETEENDSPILGIKKKKSNSLNPKSSSEHSLTEIINRGPNVNIKLPKKGTYTTVEKENFRNKITKIKKTELCKNWELYGNCYFQDNCSFAHGEMELRRKSNSLNHKYKTKKCIMYKSKLWCPFGSRCQYIHILPHSNLLSYKYKIFFFAKTILKEFYKAEEKIDIAYLISIRKFQR